MELLSEGDFVVFGTEYGFPSTGKEETKPA